MKNTSKVSKMVNTENNREIKFRAWSKENNKMFEDISLDSDMCWDKYSKEYKDNAIWENFKYKLMQYTGLKDKNGVEIYEGDIIKTNNLDGPFFICTVDYRKGSFVFTSKDGHEYYPDKESEIIGNIYKNKELLNK